MSCEDCSAGCITDVQAAEDHRQIAIDKVGVRDVQHPVQVQDRSGGVQHTVADFSMYVSLPQHFKGTHMSRFLEILNSHEPPISVETFDRMLFEVEQRLEAAEGHIEMRFPYFMKKKAPISGVVSLMNYQVTFFGTVRGGKDQHLIRVVVPATSLCPCSKEISEYGAHNQRAHITLTVRTNSLVWIEELVEMAERQASCELYGVLKRPDEKFVTEYAYDHAKFAEDLVRDVAGELNRDGRIDAYVVEVENFESIHNHSAYALVSRDKATGGTFSVPR